jgi:predicted MFS family arabinose efflux permease
MKNVSTAKKINSGYGWYIIGLGGLTVIFVVCIPFMCMPVLFKEISVELNLNLVKLGIIWGVTQLASMIMTPFGGLMGDRFGTKRTIIIICILLGITGAMRAFSTGFISLTVTMFLFGLLYNTIVLNVHKCSSIWFTGKNVVIANGVISTSIALGLMIGAVASNTVVSPLLGGWRNTLILYGIISAAIGLLWIATTSRPAQHGKTVYKSPAFMESISIVIRSKEIWIKAIVQFCYIGGFVALMGYLSLYLRGIGWAPAAADSALAVLNGAGILSAIPLSILAGRIKSKQKLITVLLGIAFVCTVCIPIFNGTIVWIVVLIFGLIRDGYLSIMVTMVMEIESIGEKYAGTATGIVISSGSLGSFFSSTIGNSLADINPKLSFFFWAALIGIALVILNFQKKNKNQI